MIMIRQLSDRVQDTGKGFNNAAICTFKISLKRVSAPPCNKYCYFKHPPPPPLPRYMKSSIQCPQSTGRIYHVLTNV